MTPIEIAKICSWFKWDNPPHIKLLNQKLTELIDNGNKKIIVNLPPRHGKSELISKYMPFWYLIQNPKHHIIFATYDQQFANSCGRKVRDLIKNYGTKFNIELRQDAKATDHFLLTTNGGMTAVGVGGPLTGRGANLLIIDDPIKNDAEANSKTMRDNLWNWFNTTAFTRLEPNGNIIIVMTRWHEDDLCGRIIKRQNIINNPAPKKHNNYNNKYNNYNKYKEENNYKTIKNNKPENNEWINIKIPAIADENIDKLGRIKGEPLWPLRFPITQLNIIKEQLGEYWFNALYQQKPNAATGNLFKRKNLKYYTENKEVYLLKDTPILNNENNIKYIQKQECSIFATMDLAATTTQTADWTAIIIFAITKQKDIIILDIVKEKFEGAEHLPLIREIYAKWKPQQIGIESVQYQITLIQMARKEFIPVKELKPDKDKVTRALPMAAMLEAGKIYLKENAQWLENFEEELLNFPKTKHDDQVDAFAYIATIIQPITDDQNNFRIRLLNRKKHTTDEYK